MSPFPYTTPSLGGRRSAQTTAYYAAFVGLGLAGASLGPTLPALAEQTHAALHEISYLFAAGSLGYLLGSFQGGRIYDRLPGHPLMAAAVIVIAAVLAAVPALSVVWLLVAARLLMGLAQGTLDVGGNTLLVWVQRDRVAPYMGGLHFFFGLGAFLAPIIIAQVVARTGGIAWAYRALALLTLPAALCLLRVPSPERAGAPGDTAHGRANHLLVALIALFFLLYVGAEIGFSDWIFTYAVTLKLADATVAAYLVATFWGAFTLGRLLGIPIAAHFRPSLLLLVDLLGSLAGVGITLLAGRWPAAIWLGAFVVGFSMASIFATTMSLAARRLSISGRITSLFLVASSLGSMGLPWLIGQFFETVGPQVVMIAVLLDLAVALVVLGALSLQPKAAGEREWTGSTG